MTMNISTRRVLVRAAWGAVVGLASGPLGTVAWAHSLQEHAVQTKVPAQASTAVSSGYTRNVKDYALPDVVLTDADNKPVRLRELLASNEPVMVNFIFTTCSTVCPVMAKVFSEVPGALGAGAQRLRMVSISIDPENDTPLQLKAYAKSMHAWPRWKFLTGTVQDIEAVQRAFDTYHADKMAHEPLTLLRPWPSARWTRLEGFLSAPQLAQEYRQALAQ